MGSGRARSGLKESFVYISTLGTLVVRTLVKQPYGLAALNEADGLGVAAWLLSAASGAAVGASVQEAVNTAKMASALFLRRCRGANRKVRPLPGGASIAG